MKYVCQRSDRGGGRRWEAGQSHIPKESDEGAPELDHGFLCGRESGGLERHRAAVQFRAVDLSIQPSSKRIAHVPRLKSLGVLFERGPDGCNGSSHCGKVPAWAELQETPEGAMRVPLEAAERSDRALGEFGILCDDG